jgi:hypothetical protein
MTNYWKPYVNIRQKRESRERIWRQCIIHSYIFRCEESDRPQSQNAKESSGFRCGYWWVLCEKVPDSKFPNWKPWCSIYPPLDLHTNWLLMLHEERSKDIVVWELRTELKVHAIISRQWGLQKQCVTAEERLFKNYI